MTEDDEWQVRRRYPSPLTAIKWLRETRGWSVKESKDFYDSYRDEHGRRMTYDFIFKDRSLPEETLKEALIIIDPEETYPISEEDLDLSWIVERAKMQDSSKSKNMKENEYDGPEIALIPDIPEELLEPVTALLNTARMYQGMIAEAIKGTTSIHKSMFTNRIDIADNVMASWNHKLPPE